MFRSKAAGWVVVCASAVCAHPSVAVDLDRVRTLLEQNQSDQAIDLLVGELSENPAHEAARLLLAQAYENAGRAEDAVATWQEIVLLSGDEDILRQGRRAISRMRRAELDRQDRDQADSSGRVDPFKIPMPDIDWAGLEVVEDTRYLPPVLPPPDSFEVPPFVYETEHFTTYSTNERLSKVVGDRAEIYLEFMIEKLFGGRSWAARIPIMVYKDLSDYQGHGGPVGSGGVTKSHPLAGITKVIIIFQLKPDFSQSRRNRGGGARSGSEIWKYGIESVLPHELTHAVINEFFAGKFPPRWLNEAIAGRFEQTRDHYGEAARLARKVVAGEYFRMRDLFDQDEYPERVALFYEQSAAIVLYLFEAGSEAMHAFLAELAAGNDHDAACAAALGIPEEGAVEEFERRWVDWMKRRYVKDLKQDADKPIVSSVGPSRAAAFLPWANEMETVNAIENWRTVDLSSLDAFRGIGRSAKHWSPGDGKVSCNPPEGEGASLLGIRMNEIAPAAVQCTVRYTGSPGSGENMLGFAQLDADGYDTPIQIVAPLRDNSPHTVTCIWSDDLAVYLDGSCIGRYPARTVAGNQRDIDYPLALVALGPVEVEGLKVASIATFSDKPVVAQVDSSSRREGAQPASRSRSRSRTRPPEP